MFYLLIQMLLYMLVALALGVALGWLLWRRGYIAEVMGFFGIETEEEALGATASGDGSSASAKREIDALKAQNTRINEQLTRAKAEQTTLKTQLDACKSAREAAEAKLGRAGGATSAASVVAGAAAGVTASSPSRATAAAPAATIGSKPSGLSGPRGGRADDLTRIKGIGNKLEKMLHGMGFYHFDQIAAWGPSELAWVDENLEGFKGRATRDNWVAQARTMKQS